jgi:hypothetical protein
MAVRCSLLLYFHACGPHLVGPCGSSDGSIKIVVPGILFGLLVHVTPIILIYIYIYCFYILHLCAFNIENAPRPNLRARSEPTAPPRPSSSLPHAPDKTFSLPRPRPSFSGNGSSANGSTSSHKLQSHQTSSCNYTRQQLQSLFCLTNFLDIVI